MEYEIVLVREVTRQGLADRLSDVIWGNLVTHHRLGARPAVEERVREAVSWFFERTLERETTEGIRRILRLAPAGAHREEDLDRQVTAEVMNALARELPVSANIDAMLPSVVGALREVLDPLVRPIPAPQRRMAVPLGSVKARAAAGFGAGEGRVASP